MIFCLTGLGNRLRRLGRLPGARILQALGIGAAFESATLDYAAADFVEAIENGSHTELAEAVERVVAAVPNNIAQGGLYGDLISRGREAQLE